MTGRKRKLRLAESKLQSALTVGVATTETCQMVTAAALLAPREFGRGDRPAGTRRAMLAAAAESRAPAAAGDGAVDEGTAVHRVDVETVRGVVRLADLETIDTQRATTAASAVDALDRARW